MFVSEAVLKLSGLLTSYNLLRARSVHAFGGMSQPVPLWPFPTLKQGCDHFGAHLLLPPRLTMNSEPLTSMGAGSGPNITLSRLSSESMWTPRLSSWLSKANHVVSGKELSMQVCRLKKKEKPYSLLRTVANKAGSGVLCSHSACLSPFSNLNLSGFEQRFPKLPSDLGPGTLHAHLPLMQPAW